MYSRTLRQVSAVAAVALGTVAISALPAFAVSRDSIVSVASGELGNSARNHESPMGTGCNYYTGVFRTWISPSGCPASGGVQWRSSDWCADFAKYVWKNAGVPYADVAEGSKGILTGWAASFQDYGVEYGTWHTRSSGYTPQPGDALVFDGNQDGSIDHVGIVRSSDSGSVYTIEGNSGDKVQAKSYARSDAHIVGYSAPVGAAPPYQDFLSHGVTPIGAEEFNADFSHTVAVGDFNRDGARDVYTFKLRNTGTGRLELHILNGAANYSNYVLNAGLPVTLADAANFGFAVGDHNRDGVPDLYLVKERNADSGRVEVHVLNGATNYQDFLLHAITPLTLGDFGPNFKTSVGAGDYNGDGVPDLYTYKTANTGTGNAEIHVLNGASSFTTFALHIASAPLTAGLSGQAVQTIPVGDFNRDGSPDLFTFQGGSTGTGSTEVHIVNGASNYQDFALHAGTPVGQGETFKFSYAIGDAAPDLYLVKTYATDTGKVEVHVLGG
ncbi:FG-GAP-like repeat-containing protein [Nonomuraea sp. NPDC050556]|uniref:FG-GAP-like repeat-containing protein n=1 Tax=Nonomuraea sp. NPDC050556 TaxID=3364369 RepID=UPI0037A798E2